MAARIRQLLDEGYPVTESDGTLRPCRPEDIVILMRSPGSRSAAFAAALAEKLAARDEERYGPAAQQLRAKADRALMRQREKRQHEKNMRQGKHKPWAAPPSRSSKREEAPPTASRRERGKGGSGRRPGRPETGTGRAPRTFPGKPGPGGRKLTAKPRSGGRNPAGKP